MLFGSVEFLFFFLPSVLGIFVLSTRGPRKLPEIWLIVASIGFYAWWNPFHVPLLLGSILFNYLLGRMLVHTGSRILLVLGVAINLGLLAFYKYAGFLLNHANVSTAFHFGDVALPLAISFFTFHQIAYLVDARENRLVEHDWIDYLLFITFFPQLIAGPIVRQNEMLPQITRRRWIFLPKQAYVGVTLLVFGLFKKLYIADSMVELVDPVYKAANFGQVVYFQEAWGAALGFYLQIYFDFSGYSDMALGLAMMFGLKLPRNFNSPYKATSIIEFWRRWHMSLSRFLRDYLYIRLGGNRRGRWFALGNIMVVMLLGGLWHGAGWTFVVWGAVHGAFLVINHVWRDVSRHFGLAWRGWLPSAVAWSLTSFCLLMSWVIFRADSFHSAQVMFTAMFTPTDGIVLPLSYQAKLGPLAVWLASHGLTFADIAQKSLAPLSVAIPVLLGVLLLPNSMEWLGGLRPCLERVPRPSGLWRRFRWQPNLGYALLTAGLLVGIHNMVWNFGGNARAFIYFQF
jgi:alginate O-acetyltransferase complex protein AlgI